jgi:putative ABC transport system permease protein
MWIITLRDLQHRRRQFGIAVVGAGLVFALTLLLTGISEGFHTEAQRTIDGVGADAWVVATGVTGPFTSTSTVPAELARRVSHAQNVNEAHPLVELGHVARLADGESDNVNIIGHSIGGPGDPRWGERASPPARTAAVDERLGAERGEVIRLGRLRFRVVDVMENRTYYAGAPVVYISLRDAQLLAYDGAPLATTIVTKGIPAELPRGYTALRNEQVKADLLEPMDGAIAVIDSLRVLMWLVAVVIIGAVTYLSALERLRDFAVLKAVGGSSRDLASGLVAQAILTSALAALLAVVVSALLRPFFPLPVTITAGAYATLPVIALAVGALASLAAMRRALRIDPALAFSR